MKRVYYLHSFQNIVAMGKSVEIRTNEINLETRNKQKQISKFYFIARRGELRDHITVNVLFSVVKNIVR